MKFDPDEILELVRTGKADTDLKHSLSSGVIPLRPAVMFEILIMLATDKDAEIRQEAVQSLKQMPKSLTLGVCSSTDTPPGLLERLARLFSKNSEILEKLLLNPSLADLTAEYIATLSFPSLLEIIGRNQGLLERAPQVVERLKSNPHTPAGALTVWEEGQARLREAQARQKGVDAEKLEAEKPGDEPFHSILIEEEAAPAGDTASETEEKKKQTILQLLKEMTAGQKVALAMKGGGEVRKILIRDKNRLICEKVLENPRITDSEVEAYSKSTNVSEDVLRHIGKRRDWVKQPLVIRALINNPKTPLGLSMNFVRRLSLRELEGLSKNKNIPEALRNMARKMHKEKLEARG